MEIEKSSLRFSVEPLNSKHDRAAFSCGDDFLDNYFRLQASQEVKRRVSAVFVLVDQDKTVAGFFALSAWGIIATELPPEVAAKLPRYPRLPATLLGRFAVSKKYQGHGLGELLLMKALQRSFTQSDEIGSSFVVVQAKNEKARTFYLKYGFTPLVDQPNTLFLPMVVIKQLGLG